MSIKRVIAFGIVLSFGGTQGLQAFAANNCSSGYNLMVIGVPKNKKPAMDGNSGHRIFVWADGKSRINLSEGSFGVWDANGTDQNGAGFSLPNPVSSQYSIKIKLVGKPGTGMDLTNCVEVTGGTAPGIYCDLENSVSLSRIAGKPRTVDVTKNLLYLDLVGDFDGDGIVESIDDLPIFSDFTDGVEQYFWEVDAFGQAKAQLRFCAQ
jgi:hypothetical protein